ncbi:MAG: D-glycerate dehydrogenase [Desulfohalobiaceae bacterium]|nr:D-glycerate dehydrogenase [Desulfohalobiaceae bacterium]
MPSKNWIIRNPGGKNRVLVTKELPGQLWLDRLTAAGCRVEICTSTRLLRPSEIREAIGQNCRAVIGQLTEAWDRQLLACLKAAGGRIYSNMAVGFNNVDLEAATEIGLPVGNTPGVLTETTAETTAALTLAAARRIGEAERFLRAGSFTGWLPGLFLGKLLWGQTLGVVGAGRIGTAYAKTMLQGHRMNLVYYSRRRSAELQRFVSAYNAFLRTEGQEPLGCRRAESLEELLQTADVVSLHTPLNDSTRHQIDARRLSMMKTGAVLINTSRGPVVDEAALVAHCRDNPEFRAGLDVFEEEPDLKPGLTDLENVVLLPHIGSATGWTRRAMATLAATNCAGLLLGYPLWSKDDMLPFLEQDPPRATPSIVNPEVLKK